MFQSWFTGPVMFVQVVPVGRSVEARSTRSHTYSEQMSMSMSGAPNKRQSFAAASIINIFIELEIQFSAAAKQHTLTQFPNSNSCPFLSTSCSSTNPHKHTHSHTHGSIAGNNGRKSWSMMLFKSEIERLSPIDSRECVSHRLPRR